MQISKYNMTLDLGCPTHNENFSIKIEYNPCQEAAKSLNA